jgi:hypothetical protein
MSHTATIRSGGTALALVLLSGALIVASCAGPRRSERAGAAGKGHPQVDTGLSTCAGCHAQATPTVAAEWRGGRHGMALVECLVCHGSTGADFKARPEAADCRGCHPAQVASLEGGKAAHSCFGCHPAHSLRAPGQVSPHQASPAAKEVRP